MSSLPFLELSLALGLGLSPIIPAFHSRSMARISFLTFHCEDDALVQVLDCFCACSLVTAALQYLYVVAVGSFPFNAFLAGFFCCIGAFVLTSEYLKRKCFLEAEKVANLHHWLLFVHAESFQSEQVCTCFIDCLCLLQSTFLIILAARLSQSTSPNHHNSSHFPIQSLQWALDYVSLRKQMLPTDKPTLGTCWRWHHSSWLYGIISVK